MLLLYYVRRIILHQWYAAVVTIRTHHACNDPRTRVERGTRGKKGGFSRFFRKILASR